MPTPVSPTLPLTTPNLPITNLGQFMDEVSALLDNVVGSWDQILFEEDDRLKTREMWDEVRPSASTIRVRLGQVDPNHPQTAPVNEQVTPDQLEEAGLAGKQLMNKLHWLSEAWTDFVNHGTVKRLSKVVEWIVFIVSSIASICGLAEKWKEFVQVVEKLINKALGNA